MKINGKSSLATGQVWKTSAADIEIIRLGKRLIHYRITKHLGHKRVGAQLCGIEAMSNYLKINEARLVKGASKN